MPPKQRVDLDLDDLAPPNRTIRLHGVVYEIPGDIAIDTVINAMQLQESIGSEDEDTSKAAVEELLEIIYDLFRQCDPEFEPIPLTLGNVVNILGLVLSGMEIDFNDALKETLLGAEDEQPKDEGDHPPTLQAARKQTPRRPPSARRSPVRS